MSAPIGEEIRRRIQEARARVKSQIQTVRTRLGLPPEGIIKGKVLGGGAPSQFRIIEEARRRAQTVMTTVKSRIQEIRGRITGGKGILGGLIKGPEATTTTTEIVKKPPEAVTTRPPKRGIHY